MSAHLDDETNERSEADSRAGDRATPTPFPTASPTASPTGTRPSAEPAGEPTATAGWDDRVLRTPTRAQGQGFTLLVALAALSVVAAALRRR